MSHLFLPGHQIIQDAGMALTWTNPDPGGGPGLLFPAAGEPATPPVRPVNGPADRSHPMPVRTKPVRAALPGLPSPLSCCSLLAARGLWWGQPEGISRAAGAGQQPLRPGDEQPVNRANGLDPGQQVFCVRYLPGQLGHLGAGGPRPARAARGSSCAFARPAGSSLAIRSGKRGCCLLASRPLRRASGTAGLSFPAGSRSVPLEDITRAVY
jgi:hypothetical protein